MTYVIADDTFARCICVVRLTAITLFDIDWF